MLETMTIRVEHDVKERLEKLAKSTARSRSFLAAEAIRQYLDVQAWQVEQIIEGIAEAEAGELVDHEDVLAEWETKLAHSMDKKGQV